MGGRGLRWWGYDGDITRGSIVLDPADTPELLECVGDTIITTDSRATWRRRQGRSRSWARWNLIRVGIARPTSAVCFNPMRSRGAVGFAERFDCPMPSPSTEAFRGDQRRDHADKAVSRSPRVSPSGHTRKVVNAHRDGKL